MFKDGKWVIHRKAEVVNNIFNTKSKILDDEFEEIKNKLPTSKNTKYNNFVRNRDWDAFTRKKILKNVEIEILNGSRPIENKLIEKTQNETPIEQKPIEKVIV